MSAFVSGSGRIVSVYAQMILDSRGNPAVEVRVTTEEGVIGQAAVPSGASTGEHEAVELRDKGERWHGKGVSRAIEREQRNRANINWTQRSRSAFNRPALDCS